MVNEPGAQDTKSPVAGRRRRGEERPAVSENNSRLRAAQAAALLLPATKSNSIFAKSRLAKRGVETASSSR